MEPLPYLPCEAAAFVEPMLLLRTEKLPEGGDWLYELKFDGYRALAIKTGGKGPGTIRISPPGIQP
jgi:ATP-dependent DNA ligase